MTVNSGRLKALSMWADARSDIVKGLRARVWKVVGLVYTLWPNLKTEMLKNSVVKITGYSFKSNVITS